MDILGKRALSLVLGLLVLVSVPVLAAPREYQLKAAFLFNFIKFVEWPSGSGPIKVGVLGNDPFEGELKKLEAKSVGGRSIKVGAVKDAADAKNFDVVFVAEAALEKPLLAAVTGKPVLTIGDSPDFAKNGGGITLVSARNRLRFQINQGSLKKANLKASSKLLGLATQVYDS